jgi:hypothetical protein
MPILKKEDIPTDKVWIKISEIFMDGDNAKSAGWSTPELVQLKWVKDTGHRGTEYEGIFIDGHSYFRKPFEWDSYNKLYLYHGGEAAFKIVNKSNTNTATSITSIDVYKKKFSNGDYVTFNSKDSSSVTGIITRMNPKSATVISIDKKKWTVPYTLLNIAINIAPTDSKQILVVLENKNNTIESIKSKIKINDELQVIGTKPFTGKLLKKNPTRAKIQDQNGVIYNVPYALIKI